MEVAAIRNPWRMEVPYFRQLYLCKGYFLFANNLKNWTSGVYRISGSADRLEYAIGKICEAGMRRNLKWRKSAVEFAAETKYTISDEQDFLQLLKEHGVMKIDDGFLFVVSPPSENRTLLNQGGQFSFTGSIELAMKAVRKVLDAREREFGG
ncbi:MAG: hypothetical protein QXT25_03720 [Candidatus Anstonellaceae archaeon]